MSFLVYDLEILKAIPPANAAERLAGVNYCNGWDDHTGMGVACICAWEGAAQAMVRFADIPGDGLPFPVYRLSAFENLATRASVLVSFNGVRFDNRVLSAHGLAQIPDSKCYDLIIEGWRGQGLDPYPGADVFADPARRKAYSGALNDYALANLGCGKSGTGDQAPIQWQRGEYERVLNYCALDVELTRDLFELGQLQGWLENPKTGKRAAMRRVA